MELSGDAVVFHKFMKELQPEKNYKFYAINQDFYLDIARSSEYKKKVEEFDKLHKNKYLHYETIMHPSPGISDLTKDKAYDPFDYRARVSEYLTGTDFLSMDFGSYVCFFKDKGEVKALLMIDAETPILHKFTKDVENVDNETLKKINIHSNRNFDRSSSFENFRNLIVKKIRNDIKDFLSKDIKNDKNFTLNAFIRIDSYSDEEGVLKGFSHFDKVRLYLNTNQARFSIYLGNIKDINKNVLKWVEEGKMPESCYLKLFKKHASNWAKNKHVFTEQELAMIPVEDKEKYADKFPQFAERVGKVNDYTGCLKKAHKDSSTTIFYWNYEYFADLDKESYKFFYSIRYSLVNSFLSLIGLKGAHKTCPLGDEFEVYKIYDINSARFPYKDLIGPKEVEKETIQNTFLSFMEFVVSNKNEVFNMINGGNIDDLGDFYVSSILKKQMKEDLKDSVTKVKSKLVKF